MFTLPLYNLLERMKSMLLACLIWLTKLTRLSSKNGSTISSSGWWKGVSERVWRTLKMSWTCSSHGLRNQRERYFLHYILYQSAKLHDELGISDVCKQSDPTRTSFWYRLCLIEKSQIHHEDIRLGKPGQWPLASRCEDRQDLRNQCQKLSYLKTHCNHDATKCYKYLAGTEWRKRWWFHQRYDAYRQQATFSTGVATFLFYSSCPTFRATATLQLSMNRVAPPRGPSKWCPPWNGLSACVSCYLDLVCWSVKVFDIG